MVGMMRILITGSNGFIGRNLTKYLTTKYEVDAVSRKELDLLHPDSVNHFFKGKKYDLVIHTAVEGGRRTKPDTEEMVYRNILMVYNLLANQDHFDRMITFGSGAELDRRFNINTQTNTDKRYPIDFYGMSKSIIHKLCLVEPKLYNFRIFNCFGADESSDRMIRGNIEKYIRKEPMTIFSNRLMDFFYIEDLVKVIEHFLNAPFESKIINCTYHTHVRLLDILNIINKLSEYDVPIHEIKDQSLNDINITKTDYIGKSDFPSINLIGLEEGIKKVYNKLMRTIN